MAFRFDKTNQGYLAMTSYNITGKFPSSMQARSPVTWTIFISSEIFDFIIFS